MKNAFVTEFQNSIVWFYLFHLCQSIWRRVQKEVLASRCQRNGAFRKVVRKLMSLAYVPVPHVRNCFLSLQNDRRVRNNASAMRLLAYFSRNYLDNNTANFALVEWNVYRRGMDSRTNNNTEGFNSRWNNNVGRKHPNIWFLSKNYSKKIK